MAGARCAMSRRAIFFLFIVALCALSSSFGVYALRAQEANAAGRDVTAIKSDADKAYTAQDWKKAAPLYRELTRAEPQSGFAWLRLGNALRHDGQYPEALAALEKARALGF